VTCTDIDECASRVASCNTNADCTNTPGSFVCACRPGYTGDGVDCSDSDECSTGADDCSANATCTNTPGSFSCACATGYAGDGVTCSDVDECRAGTSRCSANAICTNSVGAFSCTCLAGFSGDGVTCTDLDECALDTDTCDANATCSNRPGSFSCTCKQGYAGNGLVCVPDQVDECALGTDNCSPNATCTNTSAAFSCACNAGYSGNGVTCSELDECALATDNCSADATCTNTQGGFRCTCNAGYSGDGVTCSPVQLNCDLNGTWGMLTAIDIEWDAVRVAGITAVQGGSDTLFSWSLRRQTQTGTSVRSEVQACGDTSPDLCSPILGAAFTQQIPNAIYELASMPRTSFTFTLPKAPVAGDAYVGGSEATLLGLELPNPAGPWPASYTDASITWRDPDGDGQRGVTSIIPQTGNSTRCRLPYSGLPIPASGQLAARVYSGTRSLTRLNGTLVDCNTITGSVSGPNGGTPQIQGHVIGCLKTDDSACTAAETQSLDEGAASAQRVVSTRFTMIRVPTGTNCAQLRALDFP
jgi:hypothetical protein